MPNKKGAKTQTQISLQITDENKNEKEINADKVAEHLNTFFANIGKVSAPPVDVEIHSHSNVGNEQPSANNNIISEEQIFQNSEEDLLEFSKFSRFEVEELVRKINISKSSGINLLS